MPVRAGQAGGPLIPRGQDSDRIDGRITGVPLDRDSLLVEAGLDIGSRARLGVSYAGVLTDGLRDCVVKGTFSRNVRAECFSRGPRPGGKGPLGRTGH